MAGQRVGEYSRAAGIVAVATVLCLMLRPHLALIDVVMVLLLGVVAAAARSRRGPALASAALSIAAFDFLFVPPYYTLNVLDTSYYLTFAVMLAVALTMSGLTSRIREQREEAAARERHTAALYAMETDLAGALDFDALRRAATTHLARAIDGRASLYLPSEVGSATDPSLPPDPALEDAATRVAASWAMASGMPTGWGTAHANDGNAMLVPLPAGEDRVGLALLEPEHPERPLDADRRAILTRMLALASSALERRLLAEDSERARAEAEAERLRTAILSSLSHDLRTPLAGIEGAASSLLDDPVLPAEVRRDLLTDILEESRRMSRLVTNLLDMVRVETGTLTPQSSWQPIEEVIGVALLRMEHRLTEHPVATRIPRDLPMVRIDELLLEQVLLNLLENAARHTPAGTPIEIEARAVEGAVLVAIADRGPGIPPGDEERVFERFFRGVANSGRHADAGAGSGLGLTICRGIIRAHSGRIWVERRPEGGTAVRFTLPTSGAPADPVPTAAS